MAADGQDLAPWEPLACQELTREICTHLQGDEVASVATYSPSAYRAETLEAAIWHAATTVKWNAKWFAPADLTELVLATLQAASEPANSSSSAVLYAALGLIDVVGIYNTLPPQDCLVPTARFICQAYYNASRAYKYKALAGNAWNVATHILQSHLGQQFVESLYDIMGSDGTSKKESIEGTGATLMTVAILQSSEPLPIVDVGVLVVRIRGTALTDHNRRHYIMVLLEEVLKSDRHVVQIHNDACWNNFLDIVERCVHNSPSDDEAQNLVASLEPVIARIDANHLPTVARLFVAVGRPLPEALSQAMLTPWNALLPSDRWIRGFDGLLELLSVQDAYMEELAALKDRIIRVFASTNRSTDLPVFVAKLRDLILNPATTVDACRILGKALLDLATPALTSYEPDWERGLLIDALFKVAERSLDVAELLLRLRADVTGALYLDAIPELPGMGLAQLRATIPMQKWDEVLLSVWTVEPHSWGVYDCYLQRTKLALSNHALFAGRMAFIRRLNDAIGLGLRTGTYIEPPAYTGLTKSYVAAQFVETLVAVLGYHRHLSRQDASEIVGTFHEVAGSRDYVVSIPCIHALTISCYEVPQLMTSYLDGIINKMSRMVTQKYVAIHVLQFLAGLSRMPDLYENFTNTDFQRIFGVCFSYLQSTRGVTAPASRRQTPTSEPSSTSRNEEALPEYVYALAHHDITFWYMSLRRQNRAGLKQYIIDSLTYEVGDKFAIEDQGLVTIDMMERTDLDETIAGNATLSEDDNAQAMLYQTDGTWVQYHRIVGLQLITTKTFLRTGRTIVTFRRPSGTTERIIDGRTIERLEKYAYVSVIPNDFSLTYGVIPIPKATSPLGSKEVIQLPQEDAVDRAIQSFDRTSALDSHKAGVLYIGEGQTTEDRILQNVSGSPDYRELIRDLGSLRRLKGATFNTQGLDRNDDMDGEHVVVWNNQVTEMVFHVTTMMPNIDDVNQNTATKKRHIGNDHVNIVFNNSGRSLDFTTLYNTFPGQLTFVYIIITPSARTSFVEARTENTNIAAKDRFYTVRVVTRPDYPNVSSAAEVKVLSGASLPGYIRNLALNDCIMSLMWSSRNDTADYPSSWRSRLDQLRRLRTRYGSQKA